MITTEKKENSLFSIHNPVGAKLLTCLRLQLSHLNEHESLDIILKIQLVLCVYAIQKLKQMNTSSSVAIFILLKD